MKKLLIATTALVATAGVAAAEVKLSGDGRMGVVYGTGQNSGAYLGNDALNFSSRIRVTFTLSGETDAGLSFGGTFRADVASGAATSNEGTIFISGAFGKLEMGAVKNAAEAVLGDLPEIGFQDLISQTPGGDNVLRLGDNDILYLSGDGGALQADSAYDPGALYTYTTGGLTFALGFNDGHTDHTASDEVQAYSVGVKYAFGDYSVGIGYEKADDGPDDVSHLILGGTAKFGTTTVQAFYGKFDDDSSDDLNHYGIGVSSKFDALTVEGFIKRTEDGADDITAWGIGAEYALGGGATLAGGIADNDGPGSDVVADFGIKFTF